MSIPPWERARDAAVRVPASDIVNLTPRAECRGAEWFCGVTEWINGRSAFRAVYNEEGIDSGRVDKNGTRTEGVEVCNDLDTFQCLYSYTERTKPTLR